MTSIGGGMLVTTTDPTLWNLIVAVVVACLALTPFSGVMVLRRRKSLTFRIVKLCWQSTKNGYRAWTNSTTRGITDQKEGDESARNENILVNVVGANFLELFHPRDDSNQDRAR